MVPTIKSRNLTKEQHEAIMERNFIRFIESRNKQQEADDALLNEVFATIEEATELLEEAIEVLEDNFFEYEYAAMSIEELIIQWRFSKRDKSLEGINHNWLIKQELLARANSNWKLKFILPVSVIY